MEALGKILGKRLRRLLEEREMSQRDLARRFGFSDATISNWLSGEHHPDLATTQSLADFFDVTIDYLLGRTKKPKETVPVRIPDNWEETVRNLSSQGLSPEDVDAAIDFIKAAKRMREG